MPIEEHPDGNLTIIDETIDQSTTFIGKRIEIEGCVIQGHLILKDATDVAISNCTIWGHIHIIRGCHFITVVNNIAGGPIEYNPADDEHIHVSGNMAGTGRWKLGNVTMTVKSRGNGIERAIDRLGERDASQTIS